VDINKNQKKAFITFDKQKNLYFWQA